MSLFPSERIAKRNAAALYEQGERARKDREFMAEYAKQAIAKIDEDRAEEQRKEHRLVSMNIKLDNILLLLRSRQS